MELLRTDHPKKYTSLNNHICFEERQEIERLHNEGKSLQFIANFLARGKTSIRAEFRRCKRGQYSAKDAQKFYEETWHKRGWKLTKKFSDQEETIIRKMMDEGATRSQIRRALGASFCRIENWFLENARDYRGGVVRNLEERLSNIEQQIDILFDLIKEKR